MSFNILKQKTTARKNSSARQICTALSACEDPDFYKAAEKESLHGARLVTGHWQSTGMIGGTPEQRIRPRKWNHNCLQRYKIKCHTHPRPLKDVLFVCIIFSGAGEEIPNLPLFVSTFRNPCCVNERLLCEFAQTSRPCSLPTLGLRKLQISFRNSIQNTLKSLKLLRFATNWRTAHVCNSR